MVQEVLLDRAVKGLGVGQAVLEPLDQLPQGLLIDPTEAQQCFIGKGVNSAIRRRWHSEGDVWLATFGVPRDLIFCRVAGESECERIGRVRDRREDGYREAMPHTEGDDDETEKDDADSAMVVLSSSVALAEAAEVFKTAVCGCCEGWIAYIGEHGLEPVMCDVDMGEMAGVKAEAGIVPDLASCHTTLIEGYLVEGHVPA